MTKICVRWGNDVQPYVMQLASDHIEALREYCEDAIARILKMRKRKRRVLAVTARVNKSMLKAKAFHCFDMFGFEFELHEDTKTNLRKREFVLNFRTPPNFKPEDMPPRLRRVEGKPLSAQPRKKKGKRSAAPGPAPAAKKGNKKRSLAERALYHLRPIFKGIEARADIVTTSVAAKLYKMYDLHRRLSAHAAVMWRRRPRLRLSFASGNLLTSERDFEHAPIRARLEAQLIGETVRVLLFTFVSREPKLWDASLFGELRPDRGEHIPA